MKSNNLHQFELPISEQVEVPEKDIARQKNMTGAIKLCIASSGLKDKQVYLPLEIDAGHFSKILSDQGHFPHNKYGQLFDLCGNEAPLFWLAHSRGYGLVKLKSTLEKENDVLKAKLREKDIALNVLTNAIRGGK